MITLHSLTRDFGSFRAVNNLNLEIPDGQVVGLLGPNGAGKTTTIRMITGYLPPTCGHVMVDGFNSLSQSCDVRRRLGYLPEANPLYTEMRVEEFLQFRAQMFGIPRRERLTAIGRVIERCWLTEMRRRQIGHLSKGYRQRVGLAATLLHNPPVLVLDEPTSGLDPVQIRETRKLIRELAGDHTMIISSHILPEVERTVDRILILAQGEIQVDGSVDALRQSAMERGYYSLEVRWIDSSEGAKEKHKLEFQNVDGVDNVTGESMPEGWSHYRITAKTGVADLRETLGQLIHDRGAHCRELSREQGSLEQLFVRIVVGEDQADNQSNGDSESDTSNSSLPAAATTKGAKA